MTENEPNLLDTVIAINWKVDLNFNRVVNKLPAIL